MSFRDFRSIRSALIPVSFALLLLAPTFAGCGKHAATAPKLVPLTIAGGGTGVSSVSALRAGSLATTASDTEPVVVSFTRALLVVRDVRFKTSDVPEGEDDSTGTEELPPGVFAFASADTDTIDTEDEGGEGMVVFRGPFVIDLLTRHAADLDTKLVPPGMYRRVQGHLQPLHPDDAAATSDLSFLIESTVFLEGTISGEGGGPFTYQARIDDEFQIRGAFTVEEDTPATAFITFDLNLWLVDREGRFLDPRDTENGPPIESAIRHSIKVGMGSDR